MKVIFRVLKLFSNFQIKLQGSGYIYKDDRQTFGHNKEQLQTMAFKNASPMVIYGSIISVVSMVLHTIGFSTKYWFSFHNSTSDTTSHIGLWTSCDIEHEEELCYGNTGI